MDLNSVFTKSAKGVMELSSRANRLPRDLMKVLKLVDGKSTVRQLAEASGVSPVSLLLTMQKLEKDGYIKEFTPAGADRPANVKVSAASAPVGEAGDESLDFTIIMNPAPLAPESGGSRAEAVRRAREEVNQRAKAFAEARREADAMAQALASTQSRVDQAATALAKARLEADRHGKRLAECKAAAEAQGAKSRARLEALAGALAAAEAKAGTLAIAVEQASAQAQALAEACRYAELRTAALARALAAAEDGQKPELAQANSASEEQLRDLREARETAGQVVQVLAKAREEALAESKALADAKHRIEAGAAVRAEQVAAAVARAEREASALAAARRSVERAASEAAEAWNQAQAASQALAPLAARAQAEGLEADARALAATAAAAGARTWAGALADARPKQEAVIAALGEAVVHAKARAAALAEAVNAAEEDDQVEALKRTLHRAQAEIAALDEALSAAAGRLAELGQAHAQAEEQAGRFAEAARHAQAEAERLRLESERRPREEEKQAHQEQRFKAQAEAGRPSEEAETRNCPVPSPEKEEPRSPPAKVAPAAAPPWWHRRKAALGKWLGLSASLIVAGGVGLLHGVAWDFIVPAVQSIVSARLGEPVSVRTAYGAIFPTPQLRLEGVKVGRDGALTADVITVPGLAGLLGRSDEVTAISVENIVVSAAGLRRLAAWNTPARGSAVASLEKVSLRNVRLALEAVDVPPFDAELKLASDGTLQHISVKTVDGSVTGEIIPSEEGVRIQAHAHVWKMPFGAPLAFKNLEVKAAAAPGRLEVEQFDGLLYEGRVVGEGTLRWNGVWVMQGSAELTSVDVSALISAYLGNSPVSGSLKSKVRLLLQGNSLRSLFDAPSASGDFVVEKGRLTSVDLAKALRSTSAEPWRGQTSFRELSGSMALSGNRYEFRNLKLTAGILSAAGVLEVAPDRSLSGRIRVEIRSEANPLRGLLAVSGTATQPLVRP